VRLMGAQGRVILGSLESVTPELVYTDDIWLSITANKLQYCL
jgi:hypothetical protein